MPATLPSAVADIANAPSSQACSTADPAGASQLDIAGELLSLLRDTTTEPRPDAQLEALTLAVAADLPVLLWGEPGTGKTAALTQLAESLDLPLTTVIASVHEPSDFSGLPVLGDDPAEQGVPMAPPDWAVRIVRAYSGSAVPGRAVHRAAGRPGRPAAPRTRTADRRPATAARGPDRGGRQPAVLGCRRLGAEPAPGQPVRPSPVDPRPRGRGARTGRDVAPGEPAAPRRAGAARRPWTTPAVRCAGSSPPAPRSYTGCPAARRGGAGPGRPRAAGT